MKRCKEITCIGLVISWFVVCYVFAVEDRAYIVRSCCFRFSVAIFISGVMASLSDINVTAIKKLNAKSIGIPVGILFHML